MLIVISATIAAMTMTATMTITKIMMTTTKINDNDANRIKRYDD